MVHVVHVGHDDDDDVHDVHDVHVEVPIFLHMLGILFLVFLHEELLVHEVGIEFLLHIFGISVLGTQLFLRKLDI